MEVAPKKQFVTFVGFAEATPELRFRDGKLEQKWALGENVSDRTGHVIPDKFDWRVVPTVYGPTEPPNA